MVLAPSWVSSGRRAWRSSWSNQGTVARPRTASAHSAQADQPGHHRGRAGRPPCGLIAMVVGARRFLPATVVWPGRPSSLEEAAVAASLLDLEDAQRVLAWVGEPRRPGEPDVGDAVLGLQAAQVAVLLWDPTCPQLDALGPHVADMPGGLCLGVGGPGGALGHAQLGPAAAAKGDGGLALAPDLQAEPVMVEVLSGGEIGRQQHWVDRMGSKHGPPSSSLGTACGRTASEVLAAAPRGRSVGQFGWELVTGSTHLARQAGAGKGAA